MAKKTRRIFVKEIEVQASIGVYEHEKLRKQTLRVSFDAQVTLPERINDDMTAVVSYEMFRNATKELAEGEHINLVETFADLLLERCITNQQIAALTITLEKTGVFPDAQSAGVIVQWFRG